MQAACVCLATVRRAGRLLLPPRPACSGHACFQGVAVSQLWDAIIKAGGPKSSGTKAEAVRFFDDPSMYTGSWRNADLLLQTAPFVLPVD